MEMKINLTEVDDDLKVQAKEERLENEDKGSDKQEERI